MNAKFAKTLLLVSACMCMSHASLTFDQGHMSAFPCRLDTVGRVSTECQKKYALHDFEVRVFEYLCLWAVGVSLSCYVKRPVHAGCYGYDGLMPKGKRILYMPCMIPR